MVVNVRSNTGSSLSATRVHVIYRGRKLGIRDPVGWRWGIIARLRSLREEDSMAASTTPGSNYRISPPPPPPCHPPLPSYSLDRVRLPRPLISLRLVYYYSVCVHLLALAEAPAPLRIRELAIPASVPLFEGHRPGSEASLTRRLLELKTLTPK